MLMPIVVAVFVGVIEKMSVEEPSPVGFAFGALPAKVPDVDQFVVVSQGLAPAPVHERIVWAWMGVAASRSTIPTREATDTNLIGF
jgi:hypothetical protein